MAVNASGSRIPDDLDMNDSTLTSSHPSDHPTYHPPDHPLQSTSWMYSTTPQLNPVPQQIGNNPHAAQQAFAQAQAQQAFAQAQAQQAWQAQASLGLWGQMG